MCRRKVALVCLAATGAEKGYLMERLKSLAFGIVEAVISIVLGILIIAFFRPRPGDDW